MCNLSDGIEQRGYNKGIREGKIEMILKMLKANQPVDLIEKFSDFSRTKILEIGKQNGITVNS